MYARKEASDVHAILRKYDASYIILEDSICISGRKDRCHTPDIMEIPGEVRKPDNYMETPDAPKSLEYQPEEHIFDPRPGGDQRPKSEANRNQFQIPEKT